MNADIDGSNPQSLPPASPLAAHRHSRFRPLAAAPLTIAVCLLWTGVAGAANDTVNVAGTFNNWSTQASEWRMKRVDDATWSLGAYWRAGVYQFKFVFNGSWDQHLGDAGNHQLRMPGQDIELRIDASGYYEISLDANAKTWSLRGAAPNEPIPVLDIHRESLNSYLLDASRSPRPQSTAGDKLEYRFSAILVRRAGGDDDEKPSRDGVSIEPLGDTRARLTITTPGDYRFNTAIRYGDNKAVSARTDHRLGAGYELLADASNEPRLCYPIDNHRWAIDIAGNASGIRLRSLSSPTPTPVTIPETMKTQRVLIVADERTNDIKVTGDAWREFVFDPKTAEPSLKGKPIESVALIGDFNGWRSDAHIMRLDKDARYRTLVTMPEGVYHYKFVINGTIYLEDPSSDPRFRVSDGNGGHNSGVLIGDDARSFGNRRPGEINTAALKHDPTSAAWFAPIAGNVARVTVRTLAGDAKAVDMYQKDGAGRFPLRISKSAFGFDYWSIQAAFPQDQSTAQYQFTLTANTDAGAAPTTLQGEVNFSASGAASGGANPPSAWFEAALPKTFESPDWARRAMWYQIFPERFRNGDASNDPPRTVPWSQKWDAPYKPGKDVVKGSPQDFEEKGTFFQYIFDRRYGGDLQGVREKLPYLRDLGVTAIYFNPVFQAESLHKYDASDYRHIDDRFGVAGSLQRLRGETTDPATWQWSDSDKLFLEFLDDAHRMGFKVIIDGVFNHTGRDFWAFQDIIRNGRNSEFVDWFEIKSFDPLRYEAWDGDSGALPKLKHDNALGLAVPVREHLFAVTRRWMDPNGDGDPSDGIDGWRLDVASDINANFWTDWRKLVKSVNPDAYIVAELWRESREWLDGRTFDAVMNYPFARRTLRFVINNRKASTASQFKRELEEMYGWYRPQVNYVLQNLYDSHDTDRVASMCMNPDVEYDEANRIQDNGPDYVTSKPTPESYHRQKLLATIQMTFLGAPMVYYGDEVGMYGADDPSDRKPMLWPDLPPNDDPDERIENDLLEHYRRMIAIRNSHPALQLGDFETILTDDAKGIFAFTRTLGDESILIVINNSDAQHRLDVPVRWPDGATVIRLDDPDQCELVMPDADAPAARPAIRPKAKRPASNLKVESGRLHGRMLAPRTGAIFTKLPDTDTH
ncbi:MAG TPA: alpha-amylase family glycosyl hydrolase [Phycisphaerae bacterium]|nr:alpha-amylase family glycosyl hydrolase [Phycisphaerae bacterium]HRW53411.1 alpha-amylase family glycosyl hydrolase [Phycisphaerae bacterium]